MSMVIFNSYVKLPEGTGISTGYQWLLSINGLLMVINDELMWVKQCHKPPVTGNGKHPTYKNGDDWGMCLIFVLPTSYQFQ